MAKFQNVYTDISTVNGGNQFGNEPLSANAINVALQNTQAIKNGATAVGKAESATNATNATNATHSANATAADYLAVETTQITLGTYSGQWGGRQITSGQQAFQGGDRILYLDKVYKVDTASGSPYVKCNNSDPIGQVANGTAISVRKVVQSKDLWVFDEAWITDSSYTVEKGSTYQIIVQSGEIAQAIVQIVGDGTYLLGAAGAEYSSVGIVIAAYVASVASGKLRVFRQTIDWTQGSPKFYNRVAVQFRIRKIG